jgi:serine/threonine protein phosphatase PrpC
MIVEVLGLDLNTRFGLSRKPSRTTATIVVIDGWIVIIACVGDSSHCILDYYVFCFLFTQEDIPKHLVFF